ncbi:PAS domain-containing sensor histidine kinase [Ramlibacter pallidus]|uniref:histidine kinase n=1 Tax=Ramlibacter pallidus TaxID=2780087 RepID=A0ABR9S094_9BURK|nr:PAS domain-containing sensor histidine kinase [Ramlibacter pallidus]MBE7366898.1 PAS domain-containing sensor histidine kinase [Ramlibacter pallidus]
MDATPLPGADQLYDAAPCGLLVAAADGNLLDVNSTLCRWLHHDRRELVGKVKWQDLLTMGGRIFWQTHLHPLLRIQSSVAEVKLELRMQDGRALPVMVNMAERAWNGRMLLHAAVFVAEDRHKYERELLLQRQRAEELSAQRARDEKELQAARAEAEVRAQFAEQLVGMVSHDIRNPLSVIHMSALLLERAGGSEQQKAAVARIARSVQRVQHLVGDLLDFTQARLGGGISIRKAPTDLHQAVADSIGELAVAFPHCQLRYERGAGSGHVHADADRVVQAVGNLVANASNHGDPEQPVTVRTERDAKDFRIVVHNHGPAIPAHVLPQLFEPMVRGAGSGGSEGVGLGLFIVRAIVTAHGGRVEASSTPQAGTAFTLAFPHA